MAIIQISKIILRKGLSTDLPGAPISVSPPTFAPGLDAGELAYATDLGRLFLGHSPTEGQPQYNRLQFPYRNIEVLTENSVETLRKIISDYVRETDQTAYYNADLPVHVTEWENVSIDRNGSAYAYRIEGISQVSVIIDYVVTDSDNGLPVKVGHLFVSYNEALEIEPQVVDECESFRRTDLLEPDFYDSASLFDQVSFKFTVAGPLNARYLLFQYKNRTSSMLNLRFKVSRPKA